jgi:hypothetical protein
MKKLLALLFLVVPTLLGAEVLPKGAGIVTYSDFSGGLNTRDEAHKLKTNESPYLRNVIIDDGEVKTSNGYSYLGSSASLTKVNMIFEYIDTSGGSHFLVSDSSIVLVTDDFRTYSTVRTGLNSFFKLGCIQVYDKVWCSNGNDPVFTYTQTTTTVLDGGTYSLSSKTPNVPRFKYLAYWQNRVWGFGIPSNSSYLGYSAIMTTDTVPIAIAPDNENAWNNPNFFLDVDKGDGSQSTFLRVYQGRLYAGKQRGISAILGDDDVSYADVKVVKDYGYLSNDSVVELDNTLIGYGSENGIYEFDGRNFNRISDHIRPDVESFVNNVSNSKVLSWDSYSDFVNNSFFKNTTATANGFITVLTTFPINIQSGGETQQSKFTPSGGAQQDVTGAYVVFFATQMIHASISSSSFYTPYIVEANYDTNCDGGLSARFIHFKNINTGGICESTGSAVGAFTTFSSWRCDSNFIISGQELFGSSLAVQVGVKTGNPGCSGGQFVTISSINFATEANVIIQSTSGGNFISNIATTTSMSAWGNFNSINSPNGGNVSFFYRAATSPVNIATYPWIPITPGGVVGSSFTNTFIQWASSITGANANIDNVEINYVQGGSGDVNPFGVAWGGRYWLSVTTTASGSTSLQYVKSRISSDFRNGFTVFEGIDIKSFWRSGDILYGGASTCPFIYRLDYGTNYNGRAIPSIFETNEQTFSSPFFDKQLVSYFVDIDKQSGATVTLGTQINNRAYSDYSLSIDGTGRLVRHLPYPNDYGNSFRWRFSNSQLDKIMKINHFGVVYLPDVKQTDNY